MPLDAMQATKQVASPAYEAVFQQPGWVEMDMQCRYCSKLQPNTPYINTWALPCSMAYTATLVVRITMGKDLDVEEVEQSR